MAAFDILVIADPRFPGGTSSGIAAEIEAQVSAGYRTGLLALKGPVLKLPHPFHPALRELIDRGAVELVDPSRPVEARLALLHHPMVFQHPPARPLRIVADVHLLVVQHPPFDAAGRPAYDVAAVDANTAMLCGGQVTWAPLSPVVRRQLERLDQPPLLLVKDWHHVVDIAGWRAPRPPLANGPLRIGRHSRPDPLKWPPTREAVLAVYPDDPSFDVRVLGGGPYLEKLMDGRIPANWQVQGFNPLAVKDFLAGIDFFVYYHHPQWIEAFGRTIIEAMASGCLVVLPPDFVELFGEAAAYAPPYLAPVRVRQLRSDTALANTQRAAAYDALAARFSAATHVVRLAELIGPPRPPSRMQVGSPPRRVMLVTSNGVGIGHLTRMLAIARRLPSGIEPIIVTLSQALQLPASMGFHVEHIPFHAYLRADTRAWNHFVRQELELMLAFYDPAVLVFDGHVPYGGLVDALAGARACLSAWCRRGMWQPKASKDALARERAFDIVIEPGELAGAFDRGPTRGLRERARQVPPIRLLDMDELLPRAEARAALGLSDGRRAILVQLGSGNNFDYARLRHRVLEVLAERPELEPVVVVSPIAKAAPELPANVRVRELYPVARYLKAFDAAVSAAGYNSFHELLTAGLPTLFVPNENPSMDDQLARATWATQAGLALTARAAEPFRLAAQLDELLGGSTLERLRERLSQVPQRNGAGDAARLVAEMAFSLRADRPWAGP